MKKIVFLVLLVAVMMSFALTPSTAAAKSVCDVPVLSLFCVPFDAAVSMVKTPFDKKAPLLERIVPICWVGNGITNGIERGVTPFWTDRPLFEKGYTAKIPLIRDTLGGAALGYGFSVVTHASHFAYWAHHSLGLRHHVARTAYTLAGATVGAGIGVAETATSK